MIGNEVKIIIAELERRDGEAARLARRQAKRDGTSKAEPPRKPGRRLDRGARPPLTRNNH